MIQIPLLFNIHSCWPKARKKMINMTVYNASKSFSNLDAPYIMCRRLFFNFLVNRISNRNREGSRKKLILFTLLWQIHLDMVIFGLSFCFMYKANKCFRLTLTCLLPLTPTFPIPAVKHSVLWANKASVSRKPRKNTTYFIL